MNSTLLHVLAVVLLELVDRHVDESRAGRRAAEIVKRREEIYLDRSAPRRFGTKERS